MKLSCLIGMSVVLALFGLSSNSVWASIPVTQIDGIQLSVRPATIRLIPGYANWWWLEGGVPELESCHAKSALLEPFESVVCPHIPDRTAVFGLDLAWSPWPAWETAPHRPQPGELFISEVNWAGSYRGTQSLTTDEWIELYNATADPLLLDGSQLHGVLSSQEALALPASAIVPPFGYWILGRLASGSSVLSRDPDWVVPSLRLNNEQSGLVLKSSDGTVLDAIPSGAWQAGTNDTAHGKRASAQRFFDDTAPTTAWSSWGSCLQIDSQCGTTPIVWLDPDAIGFTGATPWAASLR